MIKIFGLEFSLQGFYADLTTDNALVFMEFWTIALAALWILSIICAHDIEHSRIPSCISRVCWTLSPLFFSLELVFGFFVIYMIFTSPEVDMKAGLIIYGALLQILAVIFLFDSLFADDIGMLSGFKIRSNPTATDNLGETLHSTEPNRDARDGSPNEQFWSA